MYHYEVQCTFRNTHGIVTTKNCVFDTRLKIKDPNDENLLQIIRNQNAVDKYSLVHITNVKEYKMTQGREWKAKGNLKQTEDFVIVTYGDAGEV